MQNYRLTNLSGGGGCGCKIDPKILKEILRESTNIPIPKELLVGTNTSDDAAVYKLNDETAIVATTDFFTPIVDNPQHFGEISATNSISDVYAMGAKPIFALAILGMPVSKIPVKVIRKILNGGKKICSKIGIPLVGGHSIDSAEPIYGLVVIGIINPQNIKKNSDAKAGHKLILGKPLGIGIYSSALKNKSLKESHYRTMIKSATKINDIGYDLSTLKDISAITDVTGFGLAGHAWEMASGSQKDIKITWSKVPTLPGVGELMKKGFVTGASKRNKISFKGKVNISKNFNEYDTCLMFDPQTSGGLLVAVEPKSLKRVLKMFKEKSYTAGEIGEVVIRKKNKSYVYFD